MGNSLKSKSNDICIFCDIVSKSNKEILLYEDEHIVIFNDKNPRSKLHIQIIPKKHIRNINHLEKVDYELLIHMKAKAFEFMRIHYNIEDNILLGFHIPPFYSINHLHMHCIVTPYKCYLEGIFKYNLFLRKIDKQINIVKYK